MLSFLAKLDNTIIFLLIPLILSSFTHLLNPAQFPSFHPDEGVYIRRALNILAGHGLQDSSSKYDHSQDSASPYDHPYFGIILLAGIFKIIGYPQSLNTSPDESSLEKLSSVPRIITGIIAIIDTLLVYAISERRYNSRVALFASVLFAVMPLSWFTRRVVLDSFMLPFALTSVLLILEVRSNPKCLNLLMFLSGISLGLAIFTKIPCFTLIPLIAYLIYQNIDREKFSSRQIWKVLGIWLIPVILLPIIWPAYAFLSGDMNQWIDGILWQSFGRQNKGKSLFDVLASGLKSDPVLLILAAAGVIYLTIRRDFFPIIWTVPYLAFLFLVGWVTHFHLILILPILCISVAKMVYDLPCIFGNFKKIPISAVAISGIALFGLISSTILISTNLSYVQLAAVAYISKEIEPANAKYLGKAYGDINRTYADRNDKNNQVTVISSPTFSWVYIYVFNHNTTFAHVRDTQPVKTDKVILLVDSTYKHVVAGTEGENATQIKRLMNIYNNTDVVGLFKDDTSNYNRKFYPFTGLDSANIGSRTQEVRANY